MLLLILTVLLSLELFPKSKSQKRITFVKGNDDFYEDSWRNKLDGEFVPLYRKAPVGVGFRCSNNYRVQLVIFSFANSA
jgi:hypothetical protein